MPADARQLQRVFGKTLVIAAAVSARRQPVLHAHTLCSLRSDAQEVETTDGKPQKKTDSTALDRMRRRAQSLVLRTVDGDSKVSLQDKPLLHYTDPGGITTDATLWAWGKTGRPLALAAIFYEKLPSDEEKWSCELTALAGEKLRVERHVGWQWTPAKSDVELQSVPSGPMPGETARLRGKQMNEIARRFAASETFSAERTDQLRLMPRALYRYADDEHGRIDGALYAFANGTNPEALLIVEARATSEGAAWHYALARLGAAQLEAMLDGIPVWQRPGVVRWDAKDPYYSVFGPDGKVFPIALDAEKARFGQGLPQPPLPD